MAHIRHRDEVAFMKQRTIELEDVNKFEANLQENGYDIVPQPEIRGGLGTNVISREMRIYLKDEPSGKKWVHWRGFSSVGQKEREYTHDPSGCAHENKITIVLGTDGNDGNTKFSDEERLNILKWIETFFKVSEIVIENRQIDRSRVLPSDTENDINEFVGFVYKEEMCRWTKEPEGPDLDPVLDRSFECWKCKQQCNCTEFQSKHSDERQMFVELLSAYVRGEVPCCTDCVLQLTICHVPNPRPSKKMKL
jgi:hypothetical protein